MSAWEQPTQTWVDRGWVAPEHRAELRAWLDEHRPPAESSPFLDVALMAGVIIGNWLLVGALGVAVGLLVPSPRHLPVWVTLSASGFQLAAAIGCRMIGARVLAQGFFSAWVGVAVISATLLFDWPLEDVQRLTLPLVFLPAGVAYVLAVADRMPGLAATSAFAATLPLGLLAVFQAQPTQEILLAGMWAALLGVSLLGRISPERGASLLPTAPFATGVALVALSSHHTWLPKRALASAWAWETGGVATVLGLSLLAAAAIAGSRMVLVSGMAVLVYSEIALLFAIGDLWLGIGVLTVEGVALVGGAMALLLFRSLQRKREDPAVEPALLQPAHGEE